jgi:hypothetical protein
MKILYVILTCEKYFLTRCEVVKNTWLKHVGTDDYVFLSSIPDEDKKKIGYETNDEYRYATLKYVEFFKNYELNDIDWVFFCDDDTFIFPNRLRELLENINSDCVGRIGICNDNEIILGPVPVFPVKFISGGAGFGIRYSLFNHIKSYLLSSPFTVCLNTDVTMGIWLRDLDVIIQDRTEYLKAQNPNHPENKKIDINKIVTFHYCDSSHFTTLNELL